MTNKKDKEKPWRILKALTSILVREGYEGATVSQVAAEAGVSRGLLHYYFKNKDDMMAQAMKSAAEVSMALIRTVFAGPKNAPELAEAFFDGLLAICGGDPDFLHLLLESWSVSRRSDLVADQVRSNYLRFRETVTEELARAQKEKRIAGHVPAPVLAVMLIGMFDGISLQLVVEPDLLSDKDFAESIRAGLERLFNG